MATAVDYGVTFGYRATDGYYYGVNGIVGKYHRGNDRPCPSGTPIVISGTTIGHTGATGLVSGPHLHTQVCTAGSNYADDFDPAPFEFKNGTVVVAGWHAQFGNRIVIRVGNVDITYAHLSQINVSVGQVISSPTPQGGNLMFQSIQEVQEAYVFLRGAPGTQGEMQAWVGQPKQRFFQVGLNEANSYRAERDGLRNQVAQITAALQAEQAKPAKEVIKEVEKIVEVPVEKVVVKEIPVIKEVNPSWLEATISFVRKVLRIKD